MTERPKPPFDFGQPVWIAWASAHHPEDAHCPVCDGKRFVTVVLGTGEQVPTDCEFCGRGYQGPRGTVTRYGPSSGVIPATVTGMVYKDPFGEGGKWRVETTGHRSGEIFATEAEAEARRKELHEAAEREAERSFKQQFESAKRKGSWSVGYHRQQIKNLERQIAWHRERLSEKKT